MIKFNSFMQAIQDAVLSANDALSGRNLAILEDYFIISDKERVEYLDKLEISINEAVEAINKILERRTTQRGKQEPSNVLKVLKQMQEELSEDKKNFNVDKAIEEIKILPEQKLNELETIRLNVLKNLIEIRENVGDQTQLIPKMVTFMYPGKTPEGKMSSIPVHIPMIALAPISLTEISEVKLKTELEIQVDAEDNLLVTFPSRQAGPKNEVEDQSRSVTILEVTLTPRQETNGWRKMVAGYERILRAQIP
jgi:hypothetical protein